MAEGISGSAMYYAIRKAKKNGQYIDSSFPCIVTLVKGLHLDLDYVLTGEGSGNEETDILEVTEGLSYKDMAILKRIALEWHWVLSTESAPIYEGGWPSPSTSI